MNKRQKKKQYKRNRFQLWIDGSPEGFFNNSSKARRYINLSYGNNGFKKGEYNIIDIIKFNKSYFSDKKAYTIEE